LDKEGKEITSEEFSLDEKTTYGNPWLGKMVPRTRTGERITANGQHPLLQAASNVKMTNNDSINVFVAPLLFASWTNRRWNDIGDVSVATPSRTEQGKATMTKQEFKSLKRIRCTRVIAKPKPKE